MRVHQLEVTFAGLFKNERFSIFGNALINEHLENLLERALADAVFCNLKLLFHILDLAE